MSRTLHTARLDFSPTPPDLRDGFHPGNAPGVVGRFLAGPRLDPVARTYWWRAQSATWISRLRPAVAAAVRRRFHELYPGGVPGGCVSVHARIGDKHVEVGPSPFVDYWRAATTLVKEHPLWLGRCVVLTTETSGYVDAAREAAARDGYRLIVADVARTEAEGGPHANTRLLRSPWEEMRDSLAHLVAALHGDAFVGTRSSNWCRLIDELRSTVAGKAAAPFVDLHVGTRRSRNGNEYGW